MTPQEINIAIAEACGWTAEQWATGGWVMKNPSGERTHHPLDSCGTREAAFAQHAPDYHSSLDAMHEAENTLSAGQWNYYLRHLVASCNCALAEVENGKMFTASACMCINATAAQRAEAFLRTIGKWKEPSA